MEMYCADATAIEKCARRKRKVVELVHTHLGLASVVEVSDAPEHQGLKLATASGEIIVDYDLRAKIL